MKNLFRNLTVFLLLIFVLSLFTSCDETKSTAKSNDQPTDSINKADGLIKAKDKGKDYPPAPKVIAAAEFELLNGETFKLEDNKGKVVLFNLWAIWCGPCIKEMPHLNELHEQFKDDGLVIIGVNTGDDIGEKESKENIEKFMQNRMELKYQVAWTDRETIQEFFRVGQMGGVIPQSFLINRDGELTGIFQGGSPKVITQMKENVEKIVNQK